jgi:anti-sigma factor RsiW
MRCEEVQELVGSLLDGEIGGVQADRLTEHIDSCPVCKALVEDYRRLSQGLRAAYVDAPPSLEDKLRLNLARKDERSRAFRNWHGFMLQAAAILLTVAVSSTATWYVTQSSERRSAAEREIVAAHVRSLVQDSPIQIASSDSHNVKPWFNGRVDFAPNVKDLTPAGFPLIGGRVDVIAERRVAAIVYKRRQHVINVFMWPAIGPDATGTRMGASKGYNLMTWVTGQIEYWAVSDLNAAELSELQKLM